MKLLIIGQPDSPHSLAFLEKIKLYHKNIDIYFYASTPFSFNNSIVEICDGVYNNPYVGKIPYQFYWDDMFKNPLSVYSGNSKDLANTIIELSPDYVHVNCIQDAGYLLLDAIEKYLTNYKFKINVSIWGNDLYYFSPHPGHRLKITNFLNKVNLIIPESSREINLAATLGYSGLFTSPIEATLISANDLIKRFPQKDVVKKKLIVIKSAFQSNRTLNGAFLKAIPDILDLLNDYSIVLISPSLEDYRLISNIENILKGRVSIQVVTHLNHTDFCNLLSIATFMVALNLSDGVSNSFLECCASRTYPILSTSASMEDWNTNSNVATLDPYDKSEIIKVMRSLLSNPELVKSSVEMNFKALIRYDESRIEKIVKLFYN